MLSATNEALIIRLKQALMDENSKRHAALIADAEAALLASARQRASVSAARKASAGTGRKGAPGLPYTIELEPGPKATATGAAGAHAMAAQLLDSVKPHGSRVLPAPSGLASALSKNGHWATLLETDNGTISVTISKAKAKT